MPTCRRRGTAIPVAYKKRGDRVRVGMVVAVLCSSDEGDFMGGQPFWIATVVSITRHHVTLHYMGPDFLGPYNLLGDDEVLTYRRSDVTFLHWNIQLVGRKGNKRISKVDQRVLSLDVRVKWVLREHSTGQRAMKKRKRKHNDESSSESSDDVPLVLRTSRKKKNKSK